MLKSILGAMAIAGLGFALGSWLSHGSGGERIGVVSARLAIGHEDATYARSMISHYRSAIDMAKDAQKGSLDTELRERAEQVTQMKEREIT